MKPRGTGSPYLWALMQGNKKAIVLWDEVELELAYMKAIASYEQDVCGFCTQVLCDIEKTELCYSTFMERMVE